jgi:hypothetical protein
VRFGQGFLFSPPRPVRAEALQSGASFEDASSGASVTSESPNELISAVGGRR